MYYQKQKILEVSSERVVSPSASTTSSAPAIGERMTSAPTEPSTQHVAGATAVTAPQSAAGTASVVISSPGIQLNHSDSLDEPPASLMSNTSIQQLLLLHQQLEQQLLGSTDRPADSQMEQQGIDMRSSPPVISDGDEDDSEDGSDVEKEVSFHESELQIRIGLS